MSPADEYLTRLRAHEQTIKRLEIRSERIGTARLLLGILMAAIVIYSFMRSAVVPIWFLAPVLAFIVLVAVHAKVRRMLESEERVANYYREGLARIEDRWMGKGQQGQRFVNARHEYAADLDLFGANSLFELLCVARTAMGQSTLARWLTTPANVSDVQARQVAVRELRTRLDLREQLAVIGEQTTAQVHAEALLYWSAEAPRLQAPSIKWASRGLALGAVATLILWAVTGFLSPLLLVLLIEVGVRLYLKKQLADSINSVEFALPELKRLVAFLSKIEREPVESPLLAQLKSETESHTLSASAALDKLRRIVEVIESRRNAFVALLDIPLMITAQAACAAEGWRLEHGKAVKRWVEAVGNIEGLLCIATYSYEHPLDPFPEFVSERAAFHVRGVAHPLLPAAKAVDNDVDLDERARILLISGSNMSGKSTLLRSIGINAVLAMAGAPVRAKELRMSPLQVAASIRVNDSLAEGSSRFYAEIDRLRAIFKLTERDIPVLVLLDELLQGTNSADRRIGAQGIIRGLLERGAIGGVTTHDLALTEIASTNPRVVNVHFQDEIDRGVMKFDYKLRAGVVTKSNALELMRSIGLDV